MNKRLALMVFLFGLGMTVIGQENHNDTKKPVTYEKGLEQCDNIRAEKKKAKPNTLSFTGPECMIGAQTPKFESTSMAGTTITRESLKGKISIINFWFISCPPCVAEIPGFNAIVEKFGKDQINYIGIGRDTEKDIKEFLVEHPWQFDQITNAETLIMDVFKIRWGFPTTFVLNRNAEIVAAFSGGKTDSSAVQEIQDTLIPVIEKELK